MVWVDPDDGNLQALIVGRHIVPWVDVTHAGVTGAETPAEDLVPPDEPSDVTGPESPQETPVEPEAAPDELGPHLGSAGGSEALTLAP